MKLECRYIYLASGHSDGILILPIASAFIAYNLNL